ncbi:hypothetical protein GTR04_1800 [Trichophyton interdigitale]|uniref:Tautomerase cis-CaaD-like domain-containing protein n=1 Tax=Trichophyton interdigitale TaxID=101480 RepID=A0A9P4YIY4_9EURO|nr:hypothetical protein GY631_1565 [Trichophyton interdigitale]KAF3899338.1 hypothetical protein GY632_1363 [Trichophyton interdigitale]KAG8210842.1 hypothetical protein GTR04_1800 [Trichophyton interdigitale]
MPPLHVVLCHYTLLNLVFGISTASPQGRRALVEQAYSDQRVDVTHQSLVFFRDRDEEGHGNICIVLKGFLEDPYMCFGTHTGAPSSKRKDLQMFNAVATASFNDLVKAG